MKELHAFRLHGFAALVKTGNVSCAQHLAKHLANGSVTVGAFTLAHLSDPHLAPLPKPRLSELMGKRATGYLNWVRSRHLIHSRPMLDKLTADLRTQHPDHIAVTGDLVNIALEAEFGPARDWLNSSSRLNDVALARQRRRAARRWRSGGRQSSPHRQCSAETTAHRGHKAVRCVSALGVLRVRTSASV